jgi:UDP-glucose 4-epimerase
VLWGEQNPELCWMTNVEGIRNTLEFSNETASSPWVIFASSREVYGQPDRLPVSEDCPLRPVNIYGRSKLAGEQLVEEAQRDGIRACTIRLSNVFGSIADHSDRVVPAFARAAALGHELRVDGAEHMFDFTHVDDVARGIVALTELLASDCSVPPPIHFVSGISTTLAELAQLSIRIAQSGATIRQAIPRDFDVARFVGDPTRASCLLHWRSQLDLEKGLAAMIQAFRDTECNDKTREIAQ